MDRVPFCLASSNHNASFGIFPDYLNMSTSKPEFGLYVRFLLSGLVVDYESGFGNVSNGNNVCTIHFIDDISWCHEYHYWVIV